MTNPTECSVEIQYVLTNIEVENYELSELRISGDQAK